MMIWIKIWIPCGNLCFLVWSLGLIEPSNEAKIRVATVIISNTRFYCSSQFHKIPPQTLKSPPSHMNLVSEPKFLLFPSIFYLVFSWEKKKKKLKRNQNWHCSSSPPSKQSILNLGWYTGISAEILVFYSKRYDKCKILPDIVLGRYITTWPIRRLISEMNISDISPRDAFEEILYTHLRSLYKK